MSKYYTAFVNSAGTDASRIIHLEVLKEVSDIIMRTAGPKGSTAMIMKQKSYPIYSKDGKKVLEHVDVFGEVEKGILDQLIQITSTVVSRVGDGTTSAVRLAYLIFRELVKFELQYDGVMNTYDIIDNFKKAVTYISFLITGNARDMTPSDVYDICMISTNGNTKLSEIISNIYNKFGNNVYIDLKTSTTSDYMTKEYDGLTLAKGYATPAYINRNDETCVLRNAKIYVFKDPIDTPEMIGFFTRIVYDNIITPYNNLRTLNQIRKNPNMVRNMTEQQLAEMEKNCELVPTLIMCPFISRDVSTVLESLESLLYSFDSDETTRMSKPPVAIVNNLSRNIDELSDISLLCGCPTIGKYIDESVQQADIEAGKAPTIDTVKEFCGSAEEIIIYKEHTKFINPQNMFDKKQSGEFVLDDNGNRVFSTTYKSLISFLQGQLAEAKKTGEDLVEINRLKRRLSGLTSGLVELYIGGISITDRESDKDLADDAVRNCRSAAIHGVGRATNFEALLACNKLLDPEFSINSHPNDIDSEVKIIPDETKVFVNIIQKAYTNVIKEIYAKSISNDKVDEIFEESVRRKMPINLRTEEFDGSVLTSIDTDITVLDCIARIVTIMFTSNQILVSNSFDNKYAAIDDGNVWKEILEEIKKEE